MPNASSWIYLFSSLFLEVILWSIFKWFRVAYDEDSPGIYLFDEISVV